ncbi:type II secretion system F family protein [Nocardiopsis halophila]|uniref:type II secretion system F family protein n=1 Tax=Nocardiopsis halophila TaxID=141692 RepID=UPI00034A9FE1|nr:type II secretion system F family protein [Nocardiopsis halophila]
MNGLTSAGMWMLLMGSAGAVAAAALPPPGRVRLRAVLGGADDGPRTPGAVLAGLVRARFDRVVGRAHTQGREAAIALCRAFPSELRAGLPPSAALERSAAEAVEAGATALAPVAAAARSGADPSAALRRASDAPGMAGLVHLAACWAVASRSGAGLAEVCERLADSLAQEEERRRELSAQLAGPRTTAVLLAILPAAGLGLSAAMGAGPVAFLFTTPVGLACLAAGLALEALGLWWTDRMVRNAAAALEAR